MKLSDMLSKGGSSESSKKLHTGEVFALWQHLLSRYDIYEMTDIFQNFAYDTEFKAILSLGLGELQKEITEIENKLNKFGIPLPPRPPKSINTPTNTEVLRDELMFRLVYMGIQNFLTQHIRTILDTDNDELLSMFIKFEKMEMNIYLKLKKYAKIKGWLFIPPAYRA